MISNTQYTAPLTLRSRTINWLAPVEQEAPQTWTDLPPAGHLGFNDEGVQHHQLYWCHSIAGYGPKHDFRKLADDQEVSLRIVAHI